MSLPATVPQQRPAQLPLDGQPLGNRCERFVVCLDTRNAPVDNAETIVREVARRYRLERVSRYDEPPVQRLLFVFIERLPPFGTPVLVLDAGQHKSNHAVSDLFSPKLQK